MNTTSAAALITAVVGLSGCAWSFTHGPRQNRMTACVLASIVVCLSLVFFSIGRGGLAALDAALVIGVLGPLVTILVAVRGRGLGPRQSQPPAPVSPQPQPQPQARVGGSGGSARRRHAR